MLNKVHFTILLLATFISLAASADAVATPTPRWLNHALFMAFRDNLILQLYQNDFGNLTTINGLDCGFLHITDPDILFVSYCYEPSYVSLSLADVRDGYLRVDTSIMDAQNNPVLGLHHDNYINFGWNERMPFEEWLPLEILSLTFIRFTEGLQEAQQDGLIGFFDPFEYVNNIDNVWHINSYPRRYVEGNIVLEYSWRKWDHTLFCTLKHNGDVIRDWDCQMLYGTGKDRSVYIVLEEGDSGQENSE